MCKDTRHWNKLYNRHKIGQNQTDTMNIKHLRYRIEKIKHLQTVFVEVDVRGICWMALTRSDCGDFRHWIIRGPGWRRAATHTYVAGMWLGLLWAPRLLALRAPRALWIRGVATVKRAQLPAVGRWRGRGTPPPRSYSRFRSPNPRLTSNS